MNPRYFLYISTFVAEMVGGMVPVFWLHDRVPDKLLIVAGFAVVVFFYLLKSHHPPRQKAYNIYAAIYMLAIMSYSIMENHVEHHEILH